jgi:hypothetical protein
VQAVPDVDIVQHCARRIHLDTDAGVGEYNAVGYNMVVPVDLSVHVQRSTKKKRPSFQCVLLFIKNDSLKGNIVCQDRLGTNMWKFQKENQYARGSRLRID